MTDPQFKIGPNEEQWLLNGVTLGDGVTRYRIQAAGAAVLATLYVKSGAGTASVRWFDIGAGEELADTQTTLATHPATSAGGTERQLVKRGHNSLYAEVTVAGGGAQVSLLAKVVDEIAYTSGDPLPVDGGTSGGSSGALAGPGRVTEVALTTGAWTALPATALAGRQALSVQNRSGQEVKLNYDNAEPGYVGVAIEDGGERHYDIDDGLVVYAKASDSACTIVVEEIAS